MKLSFAPFALFATAAIAFSLVACTASTEDAESTADEIVAGDKAACELATPKQTFCPALYNPVCGCDGKTYGNYCEAERVVTSHTPGACAESDAGAACTLAPPKHTLCPALWNPVCGCDGKTYGNSCEAARYVTSHTQGACAE